MKDVKVFLQHILESIDIIRSFIKDISKADFLKSLKTQDAVVRRLEIIGEASKNLPDFILLKYKDVPWKDVKGLRDKLIHFYFGVDFDVVWTIIKDELPSLKTKIKKILEELS